MDRFEEADVFGHIMHETMHRYGFPHNKNLATSVPYTFGYLIRDYYKKYYKGLAFGRKLFEGTPSVTYEIKD